MDPQRIAEREQNAKHLIHVVKSPEQAARNIELAIAWLDRLEDKIGLEALVDQCDNNWGGRVALVATRQYLESQRSDPVLDCLSDVLSALNNGGLRRPKGWEERIQRVIESATGKKWINYAKRPMPR
jgi:hypothetical protein